MQKDRTNRMRGICAIAMAMLAANSAFGAGIISSVTDSGSDAPLVTGDPTSQRENDFAATIVPFGEDAFAYVDRTHNWNGPRFNSAGTPVRAQDVAPSPSDTVIGLPSYLIGGEYVSTRQNNRDNATFQLNVTVTGPVHAYLLIDNRVGKGGSAGDYLSPPTLSPGAMQWVADQSWTLMNTGLSPNGAQDYVGEDEGDTPSSLSTRASTAAGSSNNAIGAGNSINSYFSVYKKDFPAGTINLLEQDEAGISMYGFVVTAVPEPSAIGLLSGVALLAMHRRRHAN